MLSTYLLDGEGGATDFLPVGWLPVFASVTPALWGPLFHHHLLLPSIAPLPPKVSGREERQGGKDRNSHSTGGVPADVPM